MSCSMIRSDTALTYVGSQAACVITHPDKHTIYANCCTDLELFHTPLAEYIQSKLYRFSVVKKKLLRMDQTEKLTGIITFGIVMMIVNNNLYLTNTVCKFLILIR